MKLEMTNLQCLQACRDAVEIDEVVQISLKLVGKILHAR